VLVPGVYTVTAAGSAPVPAALEKGAPRPAIAKIRVK
jgi:hypothetical protein